MMTLPQTSQPVTRGLPAADDPTRPVIIPHTLPPLIKKRFDQARRVNTRTDWKALAYLCSVTAIKILQENNYNPNNANFQAACSLARVAYLRGATCLAQGISMPRPSRERVGL